MTAPANRADIAVLPLSPTTPGSSRFFCSGARGLRTLVFGAALAVAACCADSYLAYVATSWVIFGLLGLSLDLVWGRAGVLSLGQTAFYGIGGYLGSVAAINFGPLTGNTLVWSAPVGAVAGACAAGVVGWLIFFGRLGALQATILTYTVTLLIWTVMASFHVTIGTAVIGGDNGLAEIPSYVAAFGRDAAPLSPNAMLVCTILIAGGSYLLVAALMRSPFGLLVDCVRLNADRTELLGYDPRKIRLWVFVLAGGIAGLAGALFGSWGNYLTPSVFSVQEALLVPIYVLVGGLGTLLGPFVGALVVGGLSFWLGGGVIGGSTTLIMGIGLVVLVLFVDGGLIGGVASLFAKKTSLPVSGTERDHKRVLAGDISRLGLCTAGGRLETRAIVKSFGGLTPVNRVSLTFEAGKVYCLIGPNGAGKSTFLSCCTGSYPVSAGEIVLAGSRVTAWSSFERVRSGLGVKMQAPQVFDNLTVANNMWVAAYSMERDRSAATRKVAGVLELLGLVHKAEFRAGLLSHGEQQWLDIGMVLCLSPSVILLDEPAAGMTAADRWALAEMIRSLAVSAAVVVVEHDMDFVRSLSAEVIVLHQGELFARGSIDDLRQNEAVLDIYLGRRKHVGNS